MKMKILMLFGILFFAGCPLSRQVSLFNNSGSTAEIILSTGTMSWPNRGAVVVADKSKTGGVSWDQLIWKGTPSDSYYPTLTINCGKGSNTYDLSSLYSIRDTKRQTGNLVSYRLQLEQNCSLYILGPESDFGSVPSDQYFFEPIKSESKEISGVAH